MRGAIITLALAVMAGTASAQSVNDASDLGRFRALRQAGMQAMEHKDTAAALDDFTKAQAILPDSPSILLLKAQLSLSEHRKTDARAALTDYLKRGYVLDMRKNPDFNALWDGDLNALEEANESPVGAMTVASKSDGFTLSEGLALSSDSGELLVSALHNGMIAGISPSGARTVMQFRPGVAAYGLGLHGGNIWATTAATRQTSGYDPKAVITSKLVVINPDNGAILSQFSDGVKDRQFGHVLMGSKDLYVADTTHGEVLRLNGYAGDLQVLVPEGYLDSPQGLAENSEGSALMVSDFVSGLYRVDLASGHLDHILPPSDGALLGLSSLTTYGHDLIGIQTGFKPARIVRLHMSDDWKQVTSVEVLLRSDKELSQPTQGLVSDDQFVFIAKSQWSNLDDHGNAISPTPDPAVVGVIALKPDAKPAQPAPAK